MIVPDAETKNRVGSFLAESGLELLKPLAKGWTSYVFLVQDRLGKKFALKVLRGKANRRDMVLRESENLKLANSVGAGPRLVKADTGNNAVLMHFVDSVPFSEWVFSGISKKQLEKFISELYAQARALDSIGLDHGQLAGKGHNILVRNGLPVIIDFEKASAKRKCHNEKVLDSYLFRNAKSAVAKKVRNILGNGAFLP